MPETFVRPDARAFLDQMAMLERPAMEEMDIAAVRQMVAQTRDLVDVPVGALAVMRDVAVPGPGGAPIPARLYDARAERPSGPLLVYLHGGGWVMGDIPFYDPLCAAIARGLDLPVLSVEYRLAPEHPWPAAPDDCEAAARWAASGPDALGRTPTGIAIAGDSAGGNLAIVTALALRDTPAAVPLLAQWAIYPATDFVTHYASYSQFGEGYLLEKAAMRWFDTAYRADASHWRASPLAASQADMPPTLVLTAGLDPLRDQGRAYAAACIGEGVPTVYREAQGMIHGFLNMRKAMPSVEADLAGCLATLKAMIAEAEARPGAGAGEAADA